MTIRSYNYSDSIYRKKGYIPKEEKFRVLNNIPEWFNQVVCSLILLNTNIRIHSKHATMSI